MYFLTQKGRNFSLKTCQNCSKTRKTYCHNVDTQKSRILQYLYNLNSNKQTMTYPFSTIFLCPVVDLVRRDPIVFQVVFSFLKALTSLSLVKLS